MMASNLAAAGRWRRFTALYSRFLEVVLALLVAILIFPVSLQVFSRFIDWLPHYIWTEEMARLLFIWLIMVGAMLGVRESRHFIVDLWPSNTGRLSAALHLFASLAVLLMAGIFVWFGIEFTQFGWNRISELAELPLWMIHIAWPLTGLTWIVFLGEQMLDRWRELTGAPS